MIPLALPLAPLSAGAIASAATFAGGSIVYVTQQVHGFRAPLPPLPRIGGKTGQGDLKTLVADAIAGARVAVAMPPNPLKPLNDWAIVGGAALLGLLARTAAQLWGLLAGPSRVSVPAAAPGAPTGTYHNANGAYTNIYRVRTNGTTQTRALHRITNLRNSSTSTQWILEWNDDSDGNGTYERSNIDVVLKSQYKGWTLAAVPTAGKTPTTLPGSEPVVSPWSYPAPIVPGTAAPAQSVTSAQQPLLPPAPSGDPVDQPATPAVATVPVPLPGVPQTPRTFPNLPSSIGLPNGFVPPALPEAPTTTAPDLHYPVPGGAPVGGLAQSPAATLAGIAAEVGRIEAKLNRLLNPLAPGDSTDLLQLLWQAIQALYNSMADNRPAGEYLLSTPCELDEDGNRIVSSVGYPETSDNTAAVLVRIDALAALLQTHKDLKQPICRQTPAVGQPVQVQFVQIE